MISLGHFLTLGGLLFALSVVGIFLNRKNLIVLLMAIELMLLAVNMNFVAFSYYLGDMAGQIFVFFILTVAAAESAIGLAILVLLFRNKSSINVDELNITDPFILLNASNTATYSANSGVLTHITSNTFAGIRYSDDSGSWEVSSSTSSSGETGTWVPIATGNTVVPGGSNTAIQFNDNGTFGGNAAFAFDYATSQLTINGTTAMGYTNVPPTVVANSATMVANVPGSGGTGIYFNNNSNQDELISKSKAIVFSIIF
jgi:NADH-quinone oxidoreductase subunit K